jgi:hypothetical protein
VDLDIRLRIAHKFVAFLPLGSGITTVPLISFFIKVVATNTCWVGFPHLGMLPQKTVRIPVTSKGFATFTVAWIY